MGELRSLIYRLVISKSVKVASSLKKGWQYGTVRKYGRYASIFAKKYVTLVRYAFFATVRLRYVGTVRFKNSTEVRCAGTYGSRCEVRSTQILNIPYRTAILALNIFLFFAKVF